MGFVEQLLQGIQVGAKIRSDREAAMQAAEELKLRQQAHKIAAQQFGLEAQLKQRAAAIGDLEALRAQPAPTIPAGTGPAGQELPGPPAPAPRTPIAIPGVNAQIGGAGTGIPETAVGLRELLLTPQFREDVLAADRDSRTAAAIDAAAIPVRQPKANVPPELARKLGLQAGEVDESVLSAATSTRNADVAAATARERATLTAENTKARLAQAALAAAGRNHIIKPGRDGALHIIDKATGVDKGPIRDADGAPMGIQITPGDAKALVSVRQFKDSIGLIQQDVNEYIKAIQSLNPLAIREAREKFNRQSQAHASLLGRALENKGAFSDSDRKAYADIFAPGLLTLATNPAKAREYSAELVRFADQAGEIARQSFEAKYGAIPVELGGAVDFAGSTGSTTPIEELRSKYGY